MTPAQLKRLVRLEAAAPGTVGNWVIGLSGQLVWDSWNPDAVADDGAAERVRAQLDLIAERRKTQPDHEPPTPAQLEDAKRGLDEVLERMRAERQALRDFTEKVAQERAEQEREAA